MPARTPLMIASSIGDVNQMTALLASDANNLFVQDARGWNALVYAAVGGKLEAVKLLLSKGTETINAQTVKGGTALHWAARSGKIAVVNLLVASGADINASTSKGWRPLTWAAQFGHAETVDALLKLGADVNAKTEDGRTALSFSTGYKHRGVVQVLLAAGGVMGKGEVITETPKGMAGSLKGGRSSRQVRSGDGSGSSGGNASGSGQQRDGSGVVSVDAQSRKRSKMSSDNNDDVDVDASGSGGGGGSGSGTNAHHGNNRLHWAITCEDWEACKQMIAGPDGARLLKEKNRSGSTVLMMIASGQCGGKKSTDAAELLELILANPGGLASIPERRFSKTAADYAQHQGNVALAARLRALEPRGLVVSGIERCKCGERLKKRCKVDTLWDTVRRGAEENELVRSLFEQRPAVATELTRNEYHRVNGCKNFRKELSETMALVRALGNEIIKGVPEVFPEVLLAASANDGTSGSGDGDAVGSAGSSAASGKAGGATLPPLSSSTSTTATATATAIPSSTTALLASLPTTISSPPLEPRPATTPTVMVGTPLPPGPILVPWAAASQASKDWHVIDLCCGKSLTAAMVALLFEGAVVTCVDLCAPTQLPHYVEAGLGDRVNFVQVDMLAAGKKTDAAPPFFLKLAAAVKAAGKSKVAVLGVHCCGVLSVKAIELYEYLRADSIHLMPCCMPNKKDARFPAAIFESGVQATQYEAWARHLHSRLVTPTLELLPPAAATRNTKPTNGTLPAGVGGGGGGVGSGGSAALDAASPNAIKAAPVFELLTDVVSVKNALVSCRRNTNSTA